MTRRADGLVKPRTVLALGLAGAAQGALALGCPHMAPSVAFEAPGVVRMELGSHGAWNGEPGTLPADVTGAPQRDNAFTIPDKSKTGRYPELEWLSLQGRIAPMIGSLATDFRLTWRYADRVETRVNGQPAYLDRQELGRYPDLLARFAAARPEFDAVEVSFQAVQPVPGGTAQRLVRLELPRSTFVIPIEGRLGISSPSIPDRWTQRMHIAELGRGYVSEAEAPGQWKSFVSVKCASVKFMGLRIPHDELGRIAQTLAEYKKNDAQREKDYAVVTRGLETPGAPYARDDGWARPFEMPLVPAQAYSSGGGVGLKVNGRVVWASRRYSSLSKLDATGLYFRAMLPGGEAASHIVDARGKVLTVRGHREFAHITRTKEGRYQLDAYDPQARPLMTTKKDYAGLPRMSEREFNAWLAADGDGRCRSYPNMKANEVRYSLARQYHIHKGAYLEADAAFKPVHEETAYFSRSAPSQPGRRSCDAP